MAAGQPSESIVRAAIEWQMRLRAEPASAELQRQLHDWLAQDEQHDQAWQRLQQMAGLFRLNPLGDAAQAIPLLQRAEADLSRRRMLKLLGLTAGSATLLAAASAPVWRTDFATATGETRRLELPGDVEVLLNTGSSIDVHDQELLLRSGEALVEGAQWQLRCAFAECVGHRARMSVREYDNRSEIRVAQGEVLVRAAAGQRQLLAGEGLAVSARGMSPLGRGALDPFAWTRGLLVVNDIRLVDFLAEAGRYRHGWLGCDPAVADLRLSGVFRLAEPELMLRNITHLLPVALVERTRWWVRVVPIA
ncbi:DUF4880 domain-containing protein [Ectopseudomonas toyotomiensis]|uniref:Ferric-dicitrate binding protein FerR, regulates iron transport through sigma-19 n=1 Tax=Ectopseudomonas toyotomiensis TaxID=554344 RepID=A0A1I5YZV1_9GAMM|nr:DUF4880 domain-containing protein [Pseudomonas toyotomiensis]PIA66987.1 DUF4880 domain-containing protein [Pseudomonas toyotomiensis]SDA75044.1 FecR family protein [Pseudomonas sp. NFPP33]SFQ49774.1 ferric-dicitrate binding protein FerR, regulates iron transport through sigma-19 [Pseudomonas toyotomiensis]